MADCRMLLGTIKCIKAIPLAAIHRKYAAAKFSSADQGTSIFLVVAN